MSNRRIQDDINNLMFQVKDHEDCCCIALKYGGRKVSNIRSDDAFKSSIRQIQNSNSLVVKTTSNTKPIADRSIGFPSVKNGSIV